jgi:hypothetical protein
MTTFSQFYAPRQITLALLAHILEIYGVSMSPNEASTTIGSLQNAANVNLIAVESDDELCGRIS